MKKTTWLSVVSTVAIAGALSGAPLAHAAPSDTARLMVVQALPGQTVDVTLDGEPVGEGSATGAVLGPFDVAAGQHEVTFADAAGAVLLSTDVSLTSGSSQDLVVHLPAQTDGDPVVTQYETPTEPLGIDKARVLIAHTASVAPADVRVDGTVVFRNIANGEFAVADVAAGPHVAELLPSGLTRRPILGPITVTLPADTATMVYALGNPGDASMDVVAHSISLSGDAAAAPSTIDAGSAGLAADIVTTPFTAQGGPSAGGPGATAAWWAALLLLLAGAGVVVRRRPAPADRTR